MSTSALWASAGLLLIVGVALLKPDLLHGAHTPKPLSPASTAAAPTPARSAAPARSTAAAHQSALTPPAQPAPPAPTPQPADARATPHRSMTPADHLAGPVDDTVLQQLLEQSTPRVVHGPEPAAAVASAWRALKADLHAGGWSGLRRQAAVASTDPRPDRLAVTIMWAGTRPVTGPTDRRLTHLQLTSSGDTWKVKITT